MDLRTLIDRMMADGTVAQIAGNPLAQFGTPARRYLGAELLPERLVPDNEYRETAIRYRTVIANSGTRYSPAQLKGDSHLAGEMLVTLGHHDIAKQFSGRDYDAFIKLLGTRPTMEAVVQLIRWLDVTVNRAHIELNEKHRWDAIVGAQVVLIGDNGFSETIPYSNPPGHRANAGGTWSSDAYDPYPDIIAMAQKLWDKGYDVGRIVTSRKVVGILSRNAKMVAKTTGRLFVNATGGVVTQPTGRTDLAALNALLSADGLPPMETYDLQYFDQAGARRFMPDNVFNMFGTTGREETVSETQIAAGNLEIVPNTLGYHAVGRPVGEANPGRVIRMWPRDDKPPRIQAEGWQTSLPVLTEPEAIGSIQNIG